MTEHKYRGPLSDEQLKKLVGYLTKNGKLIKNETERVIYFDTSIFPQVGDFVTGFSRISLKLKNKSSELRMKLRNPSAPRRENIMVTIPKRQNQNLILILNQLGLKLGYYRPAWRQDFAVAKIVLSIKTECVMGNHFEINLLNQERSIPLQIKKVMKDLGISLWSKERYQRRIIRLMKKSPAVNVFESNLPN